MMTALIVTIPLLVATLTYTVYLLGVRRGFASATRRRSTTSRTVVRRTQQRLASTERSLKSAYEQNEDERNQAVGEFRQGVYDAAMHATTGCARCAARFDAAFQAASADDLDEFIQKTHSRQNRPLRRWVRPFR